MAQCSECKSTFIMQRCRECNMVFCRRCATLGHGRYVKTPFNKCPHCGTFTRFDDLKTR